MIAMEEWSAAALPVSGLILPPEEVSLFPVLLATEREPVDDLLTLPVDVVTLPDDVDALPDDVVALPVDPLVPEYVNPQAVLQSPAAIPGAI